MDLKNVYDTYENTITKDLVSNGTKTVSFVPGEKQVTQIYNKILELDLTAIKTKMTSSVLSSSKEQINMTPLNEYNVCFTFHGNTYYLSGDATAVNYRDKNDETERFLTFVDFMQEIYYNTPEYADLPEAKGGYS